MLPSTLIAGGDEGEERMSLERVRRTTNRVRRSTPESLESELNERRKRRSVQREARRSTRFKSSTSSSQARPQKRNVRSELRQDPIQTDLVSPTETERILPKSLIVTSQIDGSATAQDEVTYNRLKAELAEAVREKRVHLLSLSQFQMRNKILEKEVYQLQQDKIALEVLVKKSRNGKKAKSPIWSSDNLNGTPVARYQGICLAAAEDAKMEANFITTETYCDKLHDGIRKRNWTGSVVLVSSETAKRSQAYVKLPDGSYGIVKVTMVLARQSQYFTSPFNNVKEFVRSCVKRVLNGPVGEKMSDDEKRECIGSISAHKQTTQRFKAILMDNFGNRKKASFGIYLRTLGYQDGARTRSGKLSDQELVKRKTEREIAYSKCYVELNNGGVANTIHWRVAEFNDLCCNTACSIPSSDAEDYEKTTDPDIVDMLFMNKAAKRTFQHFRGYGIPSNEGEESQVSILTLARADACVTTMFKWITNDGKGGTRNISYHESYNQLVPIAMNNIIKEIWEDLQSLVPHEMSPIIGDREYENNDPFGNNRREWTIALKHPFDSYIYLLASPFYFRTRICSWYGTVKDCYIGRCDTRDGKFKKIDCNMTFELLEESDVEEERVASSESQMGSGSISSPATETDPVNSDMLLSADS